MKQRIRVRYPWTAGMMLSGGKHGKFSLFFRDKCPSRLTFFFGLLLLLILPGMAQAAPPTDVPPPLVTVAPVILQDVNPPTEYVGHVEAVQAVDLRARVEGFLQEIHFREGADVHAGDLLYVVEPAPYQAQVAADRARVAQAEASLRKARLLLKRLKAARSDSITATSMDGAVAEELRMQARLEEARATLVRSELDLDYTKIKAPISGRIGQTLYTRGNLVNPASGALGRIVQLDPIRVLYSISENDLNAIQAALHDAGPGKKHPMLTPRLKLANGEMSKARGSVDFVDNRVDPATGTIAVWALFGNSDLKLLPGQYVTVMLSRSKPKMMPVVPQAAVLTNQQGSYVMVVDNEGRAIVRPVTTGAEVGPDWTVKSGLSEGDRVIVQGIQKVRPGQIVRIESASQEES
ncbi:MAG: efflux RND transporter periplasmic adaptor subunit [Desulfobulbaceae bacterium]|nr:efflux RND transporter periplasmic adaptor subunit [Desulfobulbaceae bacterium]